MRLADLSWARSFRAPLLHELPRTIEFHDAVVLAVAMAVGDEDGAVGCDEHVRWLIEELRAAARHARLAEPHQLRAVGTELDHLMAFTAAASRVGHPQVAVAIDARAVREVEHPGAPGL